MFRKKPSIPEEPLQAIITTPNEVVALGDAIFAYICYLRSLPHLTLQQQKQAQLLKLFQQRLAEQAEQSLDF